MLPSFTEFSAQGEAAEFESSCISNEIGFYGHSGVFYRVLPSFFLYTAIGEFSGHLWKCYRVLPSFRRSARPSELGSSLISNDIGFHGLSGYFTEFYRVFQFYLFLFIKSDGLETH